MKQAYSIIDIARKNSTKEKTVSRARVQYHCRQKHYQKIILPIEKLYKGQTDKLVKYLAGWKIMSGKNQVNPATLVPCEPPTRADANVITAMYWHKPRFYKIPKGTRLVKDIDPTK